MVTKKIGLLASILILCISNINFTAVAQNNQKRYQVIVGNFSIENNQFEADFIAYEKDSAIVLEHKETLEKELAKYQKSWLPITLKIAAIGFGIGAGVTATISILQFMGNYESDSSIYTALIYLNNVGLNIGVGIIGVARRALMDFKKKDALYNKDNPISQVTFRRCNSLLCATQTAAEASLATHLFKNANNYQEIIKELQAEIAVDEQILKALQNILAK